MKGKLITVEYSLHVFVKHDAWNEFGEGASVGTIITILQQPMNFVSQIPVQAPAGWDPTVAQVVHFGIPVEDGNDPSMTMTSGEHG